MWRTGIGASMVLLAASSLALCGGGLRCALTFEDAEGKEWVVNKYRDQGPAGLKSALAEYDKATRVEDSPADLLQRCEEAIDEIAGQRHATISRLYWYTDLEAAKTAAVDSGKPILSLRMLGKLTDEYSCANSRFFRTALYANEEISKAMRENFVLHWQSVRPVPKVTIDFGDGRTLERTVTGNSAHYVLDATGRPLDVLPGLYSPKEFQAWLDRVAELAVRFAGAAEREGEVGISKSEVLRMYHRNRLSTIASDWRSNIKQVAPELLTRGGYFGGYGGEFGGGYGGEFGAGDQVKQQDPRGLLYVDAIKAATRAVSKAGPELPILRAIRVSPQETDRMVTDKLWQRLATLHRTEVKLDEQSVNLMRQLNPNAFRAGAFAETKRVVEDPILRVVRNFEDSIALDTVRNEYLLHREIHGWFVNASAPTGVDALNERVYAELFLTPSSDPWLGLAPADTFTALQDEGLTQSTPSL